MKGVNFGIYKKDEEKNRKISLIGTLISMGVIVLALFFLGLYAQVPPPPEEGIPIALGDPDGGMNSDYTEAPSSNPSAASTPQNSENLTQDIEDAPSVNQEVNQSDPVETTTDNTNTEDTKPTTRTFNSSNREGGEGDGGNPGNEGQRDGVPGGDPHGTGGTGDVGNGLGGRTAIAKPTGQNTCGHSGKVRVRIGVDKRGIVVSAEVVTKGTNLPYPDCQSQALKIAKQYRFSPDPNAKAVSYGNIDVQLVVK